MAAPRIAKPETDAPGYQLNISWDVMVPMRDGVRLATDIYRPAVNGEPVPGTFPAILGRTSYNKRDDGQWVKPVAEFFVRHGYAVVIQDLRGRYASEGTGQYFHVANVNEGRDGYDTVEWIAQQPWSNGRVGTVGSSHNGIVQLQMSLERPPHLTAIWPDVTPTNTYAHCCRDGGAMALHCFGHLFLHGHDSHEIRDDPVAQRAFLDAIEHLDEWVYRTPFKPGHTPLMLVPNLEKTLFDYYYRGAYDEWWSQECLDREPYFHRHKDIPGTYSGGWYDPLSTSTVNYYNAMTKQNRQPQRLIMGPWTHQGHVKGDSFAGDVDFGPDSVWGNTVYNAERLRWLDRWLKNVPNGIEDEPPVRIFVMGGGDGRRTPEGKMMHGGRWRAEHEFPLARTRYTTYYLHHDGSLSTDEPAADEPAARYTFDPTHPVPTIAANVCGYYRMVPLCDEMNRAAISARSRMTSLVLEGAAHQKEEPGITGARAPYPALAERPDVLVFETPPLAEPIEVTGRIGVTIWFSSSAIDTDLTVKVVDVHPRNEDYPLGYHMNIVDTILRLRFRNGFDHEELMHPGDVYEVTIELPPTSNLFDTDHRIRFDISSSNFPRYDVNPNTGEPMGRHTHNVYAHNAVHLDAAHRSHVVLPVIPA
jgi:putative CocE/NonD family hydrolase